MTTTATRRLRLDRAQLARALNGDPEVVRQFELLLSLVNSLESGGGGGTGAVDSINGLTGVVVLDAGDVGADSAGTAATATAALAATLADIATSGSADDLVAGTVPVARIPTDVRTRVVGCVIDGGGSAITTGLKSYVRVPFAGTITKWSIIGDVSGSCVVDVWKSTWGAFPPTVANTIAGTEKPTLAAAQKAEDTTLSTWTTTVAAGDVFAFNVDSASTVTRVIVEVEVLLT